MNLNNAVNERFPVHRENDVAPDVMAANIVQWAPVKINESGVKLPWPTLRAPAYTVLAAHQISDRTIFLDGFEQSGLDVDPQTLVWCGFPAQSVLRAATFGDRRGMHVITTKEMKKPKTLTHNPANFAFKEGTGQIPGVVALNSSYLRPTFFGDKSARRLNHGATFDDAVAALLLIWDGSNSQTPVESPAES